MSFLGVFVGCLNCLYAVLKIFPAQNRVIIMSRQSDRPGVDIRMLSEELGRMQVRHKVLCKKLKNHSLGLSDMLGYAPHLLRQMYYLATSKVAVLDSYCIPASVLKHKESLTIIQMWHSIGDMKKFGYLALDKKNPAAARTAEKLRMHMNYNYILGSSLQYAGNLAAGFGYPDEVVVPLPLPRVDLLRDAKNREHQREKIYTLYPQLRDKKVVLYCPTFRDDMELFEKNLKSAAEIMRSHKEFNFVIKLHPNANIDIKESNNVFVLEELTTAECLFISNFVISDYSCIIYEAAILNLPLYLYIFDFDEYNRERGINLDLEHDFPGIASKDFAAIIDHICNGEQDLDKVSAFADSYVNRPKVSATRDICDFICRFLDNETGSITRGREEG